MNTLFYLALLLVQGGSLNLLANACMLLMFLSICGAFILGFTAAIRRLRSAGVKRDPLDMAVVISILCFVVLFAATLLFSETRPSPSYPIWQSNVLDILGYASLASALIASGFLAFFFWYLRRQSAIRSLRFLWLYALIAMVAFVPVFLTGFMPWMRLLADAEYTAVVRKLGELPDVRVIETGYNEDFTKECFWADIDVKGKGAIGLLNLDIGCFYRGSYIAIARMGRWKFESAVFTGDKEGPRYGMRNAIMWGGAIDVGTRGNGAGLFPFPIRNIQDVLSRYDDILSEAQQWPPYPAWKILPLADGNYYCARILSESQKIGKLGAPQTSNTKK